MKKLITIFCFFILSLCPSLAQTNPTSSDSITVNKNAQPETVVEDEEFNLFLFALAAVFICAMFGAAIIGAMLAVLVTLAIIAFIFMGFLSLSVLAGLYKRSFSAGFKAFFYIACPIIGGAIAGTGVLLLVKLNSLNRETDTAVMIGIAGGVLGGFIMAFAIIKISQFVFGWFQKKYKLFKTNQDSL